MALRLSRRCGNVMESDIRAMSRACARVDGINLAQGLCDLAIPPAVVEGAKRAIDAGHNSYTPAEGLAELRRAIAAGVARRHGIDIDAESEVMVSAGTTGAFHAAAHALLDPGDEVILFEPYYGYHAATLEAMGCGLSYVRMTPPTWSFDREALEAAVTPRTRAVVISNPSNPSGKVYSREELALLASFIEAHDLALFSDEIYEHFVYDGRGFVPPATVPGLVGRTVTLSGFSKIFSVTGWRVGYAIAPKAVTAAATQFNDLTYVCAPAPLQLGAAAGLARLGADFYRSVAAEHEQKRDRFCGALESAGLEPYRPQGAYYAMADISAVPGRDDRERVLHILERTGVAAVPGRAFYHDGGGRELARFCFAKRTEVLDQACERLQRLGRG